MKYTILGFQQTKLIENDLTIEDAFILRTIKDMYSSASMEFKDINNVRCMWVNYTYFLEQIPILKTKRTLMRRIECYGNKFLIIRNLVYSRNGKKGKFSYIAPTVKLDSLQDYDLMTNSHKVYDKIAQGDMTNSHNKDTSKADTSITDPKIYIPSQEIIDYLNSKASTHYKLLAKTKDLITTRYKEGFTLTDFKTVISKKCSEWLNTDMEKFLRPETLFSPKFEGYLNQKIVDKKQGVDKFNDYEQRTYDTDDLEKKLLGWKE